MRDRPFRLITTCPLALVTLGPAHTSSERGKRKAERTTDEDARLKDKNERIQAFRCSKLHIAAYMLKPERSRTNRMIGEGRIRGKAVRVYDDVEQVGVNGASDR